jgi:hypothetical protein
LQKLRELRNSDDERTQKLPLHSNAFRSGKSEPREKKNLESINNNNE